MKSFLKFVAVLPMVVACAWLNAEFSAAAQIPVGTSGSVLQTFDTIPAAASWSTLSLPGGTSAPETDATMDQFVNGSTNAAGSIAAQVSSNTGNPPPGL